MAKIITLKDKVTQENTYPITIPKAVITESGETLEEVLNSFLSDSLNSINVAIQRSVAAEEAITELKNIPSVSQNIIDSLQAQVDENKENIIKLENDYKKLTKDISQLLKKSDLTTKVNGEVGKIPTGMAVRNYIADTALGVLDYIIDTIKHTPNYLPTRAGQILVNDETNEVFIASPFSSSWLKLKATPLVLDSEVVDANVNGDIIEITGNTSVDNETTMIPNTEEVRDDTLNFDDDWEEGEIVDISIEGKTLVIDNSKSIVENNTYISQNEEKVDNSTLIL